MILNDRLDHVIKRNGHRLGLRYGREYEEIKRSCRFNAFCVYFIKFLKGNKNEKENG